MPMGTYNKGILGSFSGKVGSVVGARWRDKNVMRSLPRKSSKPATDEQALQRTKFAIVAQFLSPIKFFVGAHFGKPQHGKSSYNLATSYHLTEALIEISIDEVEIDFSKVLISRGDLQGLQSPTATAQANNELEVAWTDNSGQGYAAATDVLTVIVYEPNSRTFQTFESVATRDAASVTVSLPAFFVGLDVHVWGTFVADSGARAATSTYLGEIEVL